MTKLLLLCRVCGGAVVFMCASYFVSGCAYDRDDEPFPKDRDAAVLEFFRMSGEELRPLAEYDNVATVEFSGCSLDVQIADILASKGTLRQVALKYCHGIDEEFIRVLSRSTTVSYLIIRSCPELVDSHGPFLAGMTSLKEVWISSCENVSDDFVLSFTDTGPLRRFRVDDSPGVSLQSLQTLETHLVERHGDGQGVWASFYPVKSQ